MAQPSIHLLLADDDLDDCLLFKEALEELPIQAMLTTVNDGEELMQLLVEKIIALPTVLFLDLNMPRKNGFECLVEIKLNKKLKELPVIIYSTSLDPEMVTMLYNKGAKYYIKKPSEFSQIKNLINQAISLTTPEMSSTPDKDEFVLDLI